ncbi:MAG: ATP-binding protein [Prevotella sp.]
MKKKKIIIWSLGIVAVLGVIAAGIWYSMPKVADKHILVMFSEAERRYDFVDYQSIILKHFDRHNINADVTFCYLDCERWTPGVEIDKAREIVEKANQKRKLDIIVTIGDQATYSTLCNDVKPINEIPVLFAGVQYPNWEQIRKYSNVTGLSDAPDVAKNIYLAEKLAGRRQTFTLLDNTFLDNKTRQLINQQLENRDDIINNLDWNESVLDLMTKHSKTFSITPLSLRRMWLNSKKGEELPKGEEQNLVRLLRKFKDNIYLQLRYDPSSLHMIRFGNAYPMLTATHMGFGRFNTIGGYFSSAEDIAEGLAKYVSLIVNGESPERMMVIPSHKDYYVDWKVAKQYGHKHETLEAEGFILVNMPWKERYAGLYHSLLVGGILLVIVAIVGFSILYFRMRKQKLEAERKVKHESALYKLAVLNNRTFVWESIGMTLYMGENFWQFFGKEPMKIIKMSDLLNFIMPEYHDVIIEGQKTILRGGTHTAEFVADFGGKGDLHWYQMRGQGELDEDGNFVRSFGILVNIDDFKDREYELNEARKLAEEATLKESFLANMSHEIRTPLNAIVGFSDLLAMPDNDFTEEDRKLFIDTIHTNNELLLKLINDILDVSRIESGQMEFVIKPYSVKEMMDKVYQTFLVQIPRHLEFRYASDYDVMVNVDEGRLRQVITNFITNASKFTPEGGIIMGWLVNDDTNKVELYVEDTGIGLSEEDRKMVFSRFFKKDEFKQGTGLGLSICKLIVSRLGGSIKVKSELGKGSRFSVFLDVVGGG